MSVPCVRRSHPQAIPGWRKGNTKKVQMTLSLRRETTMTLAWIAQRLRMGSTGYLAHLLSWATDEDPALGMRVVKATNRPPLWGITILCLLL